MTTPQSILHELNYKLIQVLKILEDGIVVQVNHIESQNDDIINSLQRIENTMNLVVKLLQAYEKPN